MNRAVLASLPAVLVPVIAVAQSVVPTDATGSPPGTTSPARSVTVTMSPSSGAAAPRGTASSPVPSPRDGTPEHSPLAQLGPTIRIAPTATVAAPTNPYTRANPEAPPASAPSPDLSMIRIDVAPPLPIPENPYPHEHVVVVRELDTIPIARPVNPYVLGLMTGPARLAPRNPYSRSSR
jgi:hypothetical protein